MELGNAWFDESKSCRRMTRDDTIPVIFPKMPRSGEYACLTVTRQTKLQHDGTSSHHRHTRIFTHRVA